MGSAAQKYEDEPSHQHSPTPESFTDESPSLPEGVTPSAHPEIDSAVAVSEQKLGKRMNRDNTISDETLRQQYPE